MQVRVYIFFNFFSFSFYPTYLSLPSFLLDKYIVIICQYMYVCRHIRKNIPFYPSWLSSNDLGLQEITTRITIYHTKTSALHFRWGSLHWIIQIFTLGFPWVHLSFFYYLIFLLFPFFVHSTLTRHHYYHHVMTSFICSSVHHPLSLLLTAHPLVLFYSLLYIWRCRLLSY